MRDEKVSFSEFAHDGTEGEKVVTRWSDCIKRGIFYLYPAFPLSPMQIKIWFSNSSITVSQDKIVDVREIAWTLDIEDMGLSSESAPK